VTDETPTRPNPASRTQLRALFRGRGFRPRKQLGQTFLVDNNIAQKIVRAAALTGAEPVLEVGPGAGAVTRLLAEQSRRVVAIEIDPILVSLLDETVGADVETIHADFLKVDLAQILSSEDRGSWRCVANLPYAITGPAILRLLECAAWFDRMVIMVQQEVADRLLAAPGSRTRGLLTVLAEASCVVSTAGTVSHRCFFPQPKVDSTILVFTPRRPPLVPAGAQRHFEQIVKAAFSARRKTLLNALSQPLGLRLSKEETARLLSQSAIEPTRRAESLSAEDFLVITNRLLELKATGEL
jgi:16S rRNA (adenine1518-N6/adenine1519-N6)-dimethyltransferase